jgi:hypothetical protein
MACLWRVSVAESGLDSDLGVDPDLLARDMRRKHNIQRSQLYGALAASRSTSRSKSMSKTKYQGSSSAQTGYGESPLESNTV